MKILILEGIHGNNKDKKCQWRLKRTNLKVGDKVLLNCHDWKIIKVIKEKKRNVFPKGAVFSEYSTVNFNDICEREHLKMFKKLVNDPLIKKIIKRCHEFANIGKEVKNLSRPYFETKVVKVKKVVKEEKKVKFLPICECFRGSNEFYINDELKGIQCAECSKHYKMLEEKPKGNLVNGENLDKIKFPCFCRWNIPLDKEINYGLLIRTTDDKGDTYNLHSLTGQHSYSSLVGENKNLKELIKRWNIHILKGKIIIFEEE